MHLIVGRVVRPHGIRGEVIVEVRTDEPAERFTAGATLAVGADPDVAATAAPGSPPEGRWTVPPVLTIEAVREHQGRLIIAFDGVHDRNLAEELRGVLLWVDSADVSAPADPDEFLDHQLVGLTAVTPGGETLGEVARIDHAPASDLLVLRRAGGGTALVPFVKAIVPEVDLAGRRVVVDPPAGLLDL
ncbi:MAG TPA: ribosome maturation factor RimM [Micromonosporaceae bacterium]|nr:ribosome maturation factor RimM [Micromonosporaceae bacterium]